MKKTRKSKADQPATRRKPTEAAQKTDQAATHFGATEDQVVPINVAGTTPPTGDVETSATDRQIDPADELTPG